MIIRDAFHSRPVRFRNSSLNRENDISSVRLVDSPDNVNDIATVDPVRLSAKLNSSRPSLKIGLDDPSAEVPKRILEEPKVTSSKDVGLAIPPETANVEDRGLIKSISSILEQARVAQIMSPADLANVENVLIVTGHNDQALFDYIQTLGEHQINGKSALTNKILMLQTCFEEGNPNMISQLIKRYNLAGVYTNTEIINGIELRRVIIEFSTLLEQQNQRPDPSTLRQLFEESIGNVLSEDDLSPSSVKELQKLQKGVMQWSKNYTTPSIKLPA